ncbi:phage major capsid protein [Butyricicoccus porcorum]|uniref:Phage major capsid protein n=1 Tax=Butyricicoccus porcorum TaxID=1945634 RepID=A0A252F5X5_9FIRM|nr:phage major capsid protein [Butyricicoccus porcorum]OUM21175.1 phage major capsid protein [Butyricicoccus porcorum]
MNKILELRGRRNTLWEQTKAFLEEHRGENGLVASDAVEQYDRMAQEVKDLGTEIERLEQQAQVDAQLAAPTSRPVSGKPMIMTEERAATKTGTKEYTEAFWNMIRNRGNYGEVHNALSVGEDSEGGFTVPDEFERKLVEALEGNNIFRGMATVIRTSSGTRKIPIAEDTGEASWIDEGEEIPESDTTFGQTMLSAYKLGTMIKISNELLNDSAFDLASYIARRFGVRMGNAEERAFITGDGVGKPLGLLDDAGAKIGVTAAKTTAISFDEVFQLYYALKAPYRKKAEFLCSEALVLQLMTIKDNNGNYIWKPGLDIGKPDTLLNRPLKTSAFMPEVAAGNKVMAFGDYSYYWIADRQNRTFRRLNELYARTDQVGFLTTQRVDGKLILPEAVQVLRMKAGA